MVTHELPLAVTVVDVDGLPGGGVTEDAVAHAAHAHLAVHGHGLALHAHRVALVQCAGPLRLLAVAVGLAHPEVATVPVGGVAYQVIRCYTRRYDTA